ncbi:MAG: NAD(P)-dependent glycerol-3-phosphate dehydrogenase [Clostridia bacterium]|nr:NAD(P)-dependent glycerol-3-phosphate dehydrogenase [Clostridia bacterium]
MKKTIGILGSGGWGVALSLILNKNGHDVKLWSYTKEEMDIINNEHRCKFLPEAVIPNEVVCYNDFETVINGSDIIIIVTPSAAIRSTLHSIEKIVKKDQVILLASKGIEANTQKIYSDVISEILPENKVAVISGPSHAEEVSRFIPTCIVIASKDEKLSLELQDIFMNDIFRVYINDDVQGVEIGGALKNIIALASGICNGLGYGDNSQAALITRGLLEISRLGIAMGAKSETFYGLTGFGDLFVTCASNNSRNRRCGILIGKGLSVDDAKAELGGMVVEGIVAVDAGYQLAHIYGIETPIINEMYDVIHKGKQAKQAAHNLLTRNRKAEF